MLRWPPGEGAESPSEPARQLRSCHADSLRQQLEQRTHIVTQAERRGAALRAQADAALDAQFAAGEAQDASAYVGASFLGLTVSSARQQRKNIRCAVLQARAHPQ